MISFSETIVFEIIGHLESEIIFSNHNGVDEQLAATS